MSKGDLVRAFAADHSSRETVWLALKLLGLDASEMSGEDEEVWRTNEEGRHFKFETTTGEIKAGFGGKFNGKKIGTSWGGENSRIRTPKTGAARTRGYWVHGLPESRQVSAVSKLVELKKQIGANKKYVDEIEGMIRGKAISRKAGERMLENAGLKNFREDMTPEEYVMKCRPEKEKKELVDLMSEARGWNENAAQMMNARLSDDEKKVAEYFCQKYGSLGAGVPDDTNSRWDRADEKEWLSIKSKALGGPDDGEGISPLLQHQAGIKKDWKFDLPTSYWDRVDIEREKAQKEMDVGAAEKKKIERDFRRGSLTAQERDAALKEKGLEAFEPGMPLDEYVMKCGSPARKYNMLELKSMGAKWYDNAASLTGKNWDDDDRKLAAALADKYGTDSRMPDGLKMPSDVFPGEWEKEDLDCWMDLKSKVLGGTVSGKAPPDGLRQAAGISGQGSAQTPPKSVEASHFPPVFKPKPLNAFLAHVNSVQDRDPEVNALYTKLSKMWGSVPPGINQKISYTEANHKFTTAYYMASGRLAGIGLYIPKMVNEKKTRVEAATTAHELGHLMDFLAREGDLTHSGELSDKFRPEFNDLLKKAKPFSEESRKLLDDVEKKMDAAGDEVKNRWRAVLDEKNQKIDDAIRGGNWREYDAAKKERDKAERERNRESEDAIRETAGGYGCLMDIFNALGDRRRRLGHFFSDNRSRLHECWANWCELSMVYPKQRKIIEKEQPEFCDIMRRMTKEMLGRYPDDVQ